MVGHQHLRHLKGLLVALVLALVALPGLVRADDLADQLSALTDADPKPAIEGLAANDDPKARAALQALAGGTLFKRLSDSAVVIGEKDGEMYVVTNAATG